MRSTQTGKNMGYKDRIKRNEYQRTFVQKKYTLINSIKESNPCLDCSMFYPYYVMDFDHRNNKTFRVSKMRSYSIKRILEEIAKCDLVCANCHRVRTQKTYALSSNGRTKDFES